MLQSSTNERNLNKFPLSVSAIEPPSSPLYALPLTTNLASASLSQAAMEALTRPEHDWKLSVQALLLFVLAALAAVGLCASSALRKKSVRTGQLGDRVEGVAVVDTASLGDRFVGEHSELPESGWGAIKKAFYGSLCWAGSSKLGELESGNWRGTPPVSAAESAWDKQRNAVWSSPLWQRRILMGERCELPRFSGLILYDEKGFPLHNNFPKKGIPPHQDKPAAVVTTTLKDLL